MKSKIGLIMAAAALLMLSAVASAQMMGHHGMDEMPPFPLFLKAANLTAEQQTQVHKILGDNHAAFRNLFAQMHAAREQMANKLFSAGPLSASDLSAQTAQINQLQQQLMMREVSVALQIRAVLTTDQLQRVAQFHNQFENLHNQMRALIGGPGPGGDEPPPGPPPD